MRNAACAASKTSKVPTQDALLFISYSMVVLYYDVYCAILCVDIDTGQAEKMPDHGGN